MPTRDEVYESVKGLLIENFSVPADRITPQAQFRGTLGMDSLDIVDLVFFLRQQFGVSESLDDYRELHTMDKLCAYIVEHVS